MPLRRSMAALALSLCALGATGCDNLSFEFKGLRIELPWFEFNSGSVAVNPLFLRAEKKYQSGDFKGA